MRNQKANHCTKRIRPAPAIPIAARLLGLFLFAIVAGCAGETRPAQLDQAEKALAAQPPQYDIAMRDATAVLTMDAPSSQAEAHYIRGLVIESRADSNTAGRDLPAARAEYNLALAHTPSKPVEARVYAQLGNVSYFLEDYATSLRDFTLAFNDLDRPEWKSWILYRMGICQQRLGRFADADVTFGKVEELYSGTEPAQRSKARKGVHGFYVQLGAFSKPQDAQKAVSAVEGVGSVAVRTMQGNLTVIRASSVPTYSQALALKSRLSAQYPQATVGP